MSKQVFINFPVNDLEKSVKFYEALGFTKNEMFSDERGAALQWSDDIVFMLLTREFYGQFLKDKTVANTQDTSGALVALSMDSREAVQGFADTAKQNGGDWHMAALNEGMDGMFCLEVQDLDGNTLEPMWMDMSFDPHHAE